MKKLITTILVLVLLSSMVFAQGDGKPETTGQPEETGQPETTGQPEVVPRTDQTGDGEGEQIRERIQETMTLNDTERDVRIPNPPNHKNIRIGRSEKAKMLSNIYRNLRLKFHADVPCSRFLRS